MPADILSGSDTLISSSDAESLMTASICFADNAVSETRENIRITARDATGDGRFQYPEAARKEGLISVLSTPLMVDGKAIGLIRVYSDSERDFTRDESEFMEAVAGVSALAIQNARLHAALRAAFELQNTYTYQVFED